MLEPERLRVGVCAGTTTDEWNAVTKEMDQLRPIQLGSTDDQNNAGGMMADAKDNGSPENGGDIQRTWCGGECVDSNFATRMGGVKGWKNSDSGTETTPTKCSTKHAQDKKSGTRA